MNPLVQCSLDCGRVALPNWFALAILNCCSQISDCSRNVTPVSCFTTSLKYSGESTPLAWIISLAFRLRSLLERRPGARNRADAFTDMRPLLLAGYVFP